jgi:diguanylate cyclase (GGDEF)-like protein
VFTRNALQFASAFEILLFAFALADRFSQMRKEKIIAQEQALAAQALQVDSLRSSEILLEARVAQRTEELRHANQKLEALSMSDGLTAIPNRRCFDEVLAREWRRSARTGHSLALAMIDVDWFKKYNDRYGHQSGDACLRQVARVLNTTVCRTGDLVARYGGEEFVFIAPSINGPSALALAQKVCETLQLLALAHADSFYGCVTVSIGVAVSFPIEGLESTILIKRADEALYRAKAMGRNQAVLAD